MIRIILGVLASLVAVNAAKTPVLIWSPSRPLSDLPQSYAGSSLTSDSFHKKYLQPLSTSDGKSLLIFQQDKLSVEDFTNHADVYNPNSDGGAFKNVKSAMDGQFSVHLPGVFEATSAINTLSTSFPGEVIRVDNPSDIDSKKLEANKSYLIIVTLQPIDVSNEFDSFKKNDEDIGKILHSLTKRDIKYSAVYTGESPSKISNDVVQSGRKLLDAGDTDDMNGTFVAKNGILMFLKYVTVSIKLADDENDDDPYTDIFAFNDESQLEISDVTKKTMNLKLTMKGNGTATLEFVILSSNQYEFVSVNETFSYEGTGEATKYNIDEMPMKFKIQATRGFCYHCSMLRTQPWLKNYNSTNKPIVNMKLFGFQLEAFNPYSNSTVRFTDNVWDCVEFFTIPIWMGIITTLLLVMVLFYGITMISNLTTMDRFDDPKGKTITVTVNE